MLRINSEPRLPAVFRDRLGALTMRGPAIIARTMSIPTKRGRAGRAWQYHSRSDTHSKVACWAVLFDLLRECDVFREQASRGRVAFGVNHELIGPINKTLDLVLTIPTATRREGTHRRDLGELAADYGIALEEQDRRVLRDLPRIEEDISSDTSEVAVALEAKACMTEHLKSIPRLHAEILATGYLAKRAVPACVTVSYSLVNAARTFRTPSVGEKVNRHNQPEDAARVVRMLGSAIPLARDVGSFGYDVIGVTVLECANDGSEVIVTEGEPAPSKSQHYHYERMISSLCSQYRSRFR
jgi:hypothetical protein